MSLECDLKPFQNDLGKVAKIETQLIGWPDRERPPISNKIKAKGFHNLLLRFMTLIKYGLRKNCSPMKICGELLTKAVRVSRKLTLKGRLDLNLRCKIRPIFARNLLLKRLKMVKTETISRQRTISLLAAKMPANWPLCRRSQASHQIRLSKTKAWM